MLRRYCNTTNAMKDLLKKLWNNVNGVSESDFFTQQELEKLLKEELEMDLIDWPIYEAELQNRTLQNSEKDVEEKESESPVKFERRWPSKYIK